jgi:hypothetical protein
MRAIGKLVTLTLPLLLLCAASPALAAPFGKKGDVAFAGERLFGFQSTAVHEERDPPQDDIDNDWTYFGIGWRGNYISDFSPYDVPRFGFDFLLIDGLSLGGSLGFASVDGDVDNNGPFGDDNWDGSALLFLVRVGYVYMFNDVIGIWPRGGLQYHSFEVDNGWEENAFGLNLECMFPITPTEHFGFLVGPTIDFDFTGERDYDDAGPEWDRRYRTIGIQAGVFGWL